MRKQRLQRFERVVACDRPIYCIYCGQKVEDTTESPPTVTPCKHTLFVAHDEGYEFLADRVIDQLRAKGFDVNAKGGCFEIGPPRTGARGLTPDALTDELEFIDGLKIASHVSMSGYVGFAPIDEDWE